MQNKLSHTQQQPGLLTKTAHFARSHWLALSVIMATGAILTNRHYNNKYHAIARDPNSTPAQLLEVSKTFSDYSRGYVSIYDKEEILTDIASHKNASPEVILDAILKMRWNTRHMLADRTDVSVEVLRQLGSDLPNDGGEYTAGMSYENGDPIRGGSDHLGGVRFHIARNPNTPVDLLDKIAATNPRGVAEAYRLRKLDKTKK